MEHVDGRHPAQIAFGGGTSVRDATRAKPAFRNMHMLPSVPALDPVETCSPPHQITDDVAGAFTQGVAQYLTQPAGVLARHSRADGLSQYAARVSDIADVGARAAEPWPGPACRRAYRAAPFPFFRRSVRS
ncbi:conserved protein of unknown function [Burkholderia multivorans]